MSDRYKFVWSAFYLIILLGMFGCTPKTVPPLTPIKPDLIVYTSMEEAVYEPILKEYQERTGVIIQVLNGTNQDLQQMIDEKILADQCDVVWGINSIILEHNRNCWEAYKSPASDDLFPEFRASNRNWTCFSALPLVIIYNTKVVTYREIPEGWDSLLEPHWNGRIAFMDPETSDVYSHALVSAACSVKDPALFLSALADNLDGCLLPSLTDLNQVIADGRYFIGITLEEKAETLKLEGADIDYVYPKEGSCALLDGTAIVAGCQNYDQGIAFIDFTLGKDVQQFLTNNIKRRSIRSDVLPPSGSGLRSPLLVTSADPVQLARQYRFVLQEWNFYKTKLLEERP